MESGCYVSYILLFISYADSQTLISACEDEPGPAEEKIKEIYGPGSHKDLRLSGLKIKDNEKKSLTTGS